MKHTFFKMSKGFRKFFLVYYLVFAALCSVFMLALALFVHNSTVRAVKKETGQTLHQISEYMDGQLQEYRDIALNIGRLDRLATIVNHSPEDLDYSRMDANEMFLLIKDLVSLKALNHKVKNLVVYPFGKTYVVADYGTNSLEGFYESTFFSQPNVASPYLRPMARGEFVFLSAGSVKNGQFPPETMFITTITGKNATQYGNVLISLDEKYIKNDINRLIGTSESVYNIFNGEGNYLFGNGEVFPKEADFLASLDVRGMETLQAEGVYGGWKYYISLPESSMRASAAQLLAVFLMSWLLILVAGVPLIYMLCNKNYTPIRRLTEIIAGETDEGEYEYEALYIAVSSILKDKRLVQQQMAIYRPVLVNSLLLELADGTQDKAITLEGLNALGVELPFEKCMCISILLSADAKRDLAFEIAETVREIEQSMCWGVMLDKQTGMLILNAREMRVLQEKCTGLCGTLQQHPGIVLYGVSAPAGLIEDLGTVYRQARRALEYRPVAGADKMIACEKLPGEMAATNLNDMRTVYEMLVSGRTGDAQDSVGLFFEHNTAHGLLNVDSLKDLQQLLMVLIQRAEQQCGCELGHLAGPVRAWDGCGHDSAGQLCRLAAETCSGLAAALQVNRERLAKRAEDSLVQFIHDNLFSYDLSLGKIAAEFNLSESAVSRKVKQITGKNFLDYMNRARIDKACGLLKDGNYNINHIAKYVGFSSDITFRRLFIKYMGMSPGEYRSINKT